MYTFIDLAVDVFKLTKVSMTAREVWDTAVQYGYDQKMTQRRSGGNSYSSMHERLGSDSRKPDGSICTDGFKVVGGRNVTLYKLRDRIAVDTHDGEISNSSKKSSNSTVDRKTVNKPHNRIIFGAPGTGKSHILEEERAEFGERYERVTFHPDYTYAHFVGTYKPVMVKNEETGKNEIEYKFVAGPFLRAYVAAKKSETPFLLIIEEINRANVAAVFGDVFQLLDRKEDGVSEYEVTASLDVQKYLKEEQGITDFEKLCLPKNMYIWATMNSADQGVFPMDTAFKRRWHFEYMDLDEGAKKIETWTNGEKWNDFRVAINKKLIDEAHVNEDKCMGPFFLTKTEIEKWGKPEFADIFKSKILMYLFEDAAKQKRSSIFSDKANTFSRLCKAFDDNEAFRDNQLNQMVKSTPAGDEDGEVNDGASDVE